ncbi:MAG: DUF3365 domain-containing protein [candidate division WOR-3 bacterium]|nr:DUF3365 domain-containing protein [candidate division WOR-3 bacterium]MCX7947264.1 DUF3365 domain-containing protein [candidate division WOR-3 bacterium]MDW8150179.1 DUF3365 domain-containing protein [candidate division WOR-3 bacterium]
MKILTLFLFSEISDYEKQQIIDIGEKTAMFLIDSLRKELLNALSKNPENAIEVCSKKAQSITKSIENKTGYKLKRTTFKYRNQLNKPDKYEEEVLSIFEKSNPMPNYYIQKVKEGKTEVYRYYKPLKVDGVCIMCHGDRNSMNENILKKINKIYPNDKAHGYKVGEFRGVVRVSIPVEKIKKGG